MAEKKLCPCGSGKAYDECCEPIIKGKGGDASVELCKSDRNFTSWLCSYMDEVDNLKHKLNAKQCASWVKAGTKSPGGFGFLK